MLVTVLIILLVLALVGGLPVWPYSRAYGYGPSSVLGIILLIVLVLAIMGHLPI